MKQSLWWVPGHEWEATYNNIGKRKWCPICATEKNAAKQRLTIEEMRAIAESRGGKCISDFYVNIDTKLEWECIHGHRFKARPDTVKRGQWCPECKASISENIVRAFFEELFRNRFPQVWPSWLRNRKGQVMQIDGFCKKLKIGFEYQGQQHFESDHYLNITGNNTFEQRQRYDREKVELCTQRGIRLFRIHHKVMKKNGLEERADELRSFIKRESKKLKIILPNHIDRIRIDPMKVYIEDKLTPILEVIKSKGGGIVQCEYSGARAKMKVKCSNGHIWDAQPYHLKAGVWCPYCSGNIKLDLEELKAHAKKRGGRCLSKGYINNRTKLRWKCQRGHEWEATPAHVKNGTWCPFCAGNRLYSIEFFRKLAAERGGQCLSIGYINIHSKLKWRCEEGHEWMATPNSVKRGSWCPICARKIKKPIDIIKKI